MEGLNGSRAVPSPPAAAWYGLVHGLVLLVILVANALILLLLHSMDNYRRYRVFQFMYWLSLADLAVGLLSVFPAMLEELGGNRFAIPSDFFCRLIRFCQAFFPYLSVYIKVCLALDRYLFLCIPQPTLRYPGLTINRMVLVALVLSLLLSTPQLFSWTFDYRNATWTDSDELLVPKCVNVLTRSGRLTYSVYLTATWFFLPLAVFAISWGHICIILSSSCHRRSPTRPHSHLGEAIQLGKRFTYPGTGESEREAMMEATFWDAYNHTVVRARKKATMMTLVTIGAYIFCLLPSSISTIYIASCYSCYLKSSAKEAIKLASMLFEMNSAVNPWIYLSFSRTLRQTLRKVSRQFFCRQRRTTVQ